MDETDGRWQLAGDARANARNHGYASPRHEWNEMTDSRYTASILCPLYSKPTRTWSDRCTNMYEVPGIRTGPHVSTVKWDALKTTHP